MKKTMKKKLVLLLLVAVFALVMGGAYTLYENLAGQESGAMTEREDTEMGSSQNRVIAPDFTAEDGEGEEVSLSDMRGKPVVVNFWASWCGPCKSEMPAFEELYQTYGDEIEFMMVNMTDSGRETLKSAKRFVEESGYTFPVYYDTQLSAAMAYGVNSIPATYFIASDGSAVAYGLGALNEASIQKGIDMLLEKG